MSSSNHYNPIIEKLLERIAFLQGSLYHIKSDLSRFQEDYQKSREKGKTIDFRLGTSLIIRDFSGPTDKGWNYAYSTKKTYTVKLSNYKEYNERVIFEYAAYTILQSYEAFQFFTKSSLSIYFSNNTKEFSSHRIYAEPKRNICKRLQNGALLKERKSLDQQYLLQVLNPGKFSNNYFKSLRKISGHYKEFENSNNGNIRLVDFHKVFGSCRHAITHDESIISKASIKKFNETQLKILDYFVEDLNDEEYAIRLTMRKHQNYCK